ncbi:hypothetical protein ACR96N_18890, partial [Klebsiella pneumoniae]
SHRALSEHKTLSVNWSHYQEWLQGMEWFAIQGHYWREVSIEQLVADDIAM